MGTANHQVFISYSHRDRTYAHKLTAELSKYSIDYWIDDRIDYGSDWPRVIQKNLEASAAVIVIMSSHAYNSNWVQNEVAFAQGEGKLSFPVLLEGKAWVSLASAQYVDVRKGNLPPVSFFERVAKQVGVQSKATKRAASNPQDQSPFSEPQVPAQITQALLRMVANDVNAKVKVGLFTLSYTPAKPRDDAPRSLDSALEHLDLLERYNPAAFLEYNTNVDKTMSGAATGIAALALTNPLTAPFGAMQLVNQFKKKYDLQKRLHLYLETLTGDDLRGDKISQFVNRLIAIHITHNIPLTALRVQQV